MTPPTAILLRLLAAERADGRTSALGNVALFTAGAALASCWDVPLAGPKVFTDSPALVARELAIVAVLGVAAALCIVPHRSAALRAVARALLVVVHLLWFSAAAAFTVLLGWSVPAWVWMVDGAVVLIALASAVSPRARFHIPIALPVGIAITALLSGWGREDGIIRCDDYLRIRTSAAAVLIPSASELERCTSGDSVMVARYPRHFWEYPDGRRFLVTTQRGLLNYVGRGQHIADWFGGAICRADVGVGERPSCFFDGKAQDIVESRLHDRLYVAAHDQRQGTVFALPLSGPFQAIGEAHLRGKVAAGMYIDDEQNVIGAFEDEGWQLYELRASDLTPLATLPAPMLPDGVHYDQQLHQGIICAAIGPLRRIDGQAYAAVAFDGVPFSYRPLAPSSEYPSSWLALTWGCDWDPVTRRAYVAVATSGLLEEIDYDTGRILRRSFVGFGVRSVAFDPSRRRIYAGFFLSGDVIAIDADSGAVVDRWFAGHFVRYVTLSRDQHSLLVASSMGIVRIPLPAAPAATEPVAGPGV